MRDLEVANATIKERADVIENAAAIQTTLVECVLRDQGLDSIIRTAADGLNATVFIFNHRMELRARVGPLPTHTTVEQAPIQFSSVPRDEIGPRTFVLGEDGPIVSSQRISDVSSPRGWVAILDPGGRRVATFLTPASISITVALFD